MAGFVLGSAAIVFLLWNQRRRPLILIALLTVISGNLLCLAATGFSFYMGVRFLAGIGCGLMTQAYGILAASRRPERNFAITSAATLVFVAACDAAAPWLTARYGVDALFVLIASLAAMAILGVGLIPERKPSFSPLLKSADLDTSAHRWRRAALAVLMTLLYYTPVGAFWAYAAKIGMSHGETPGRVAEVISAGFLVAGFAGSSVSMLPAVRGRHRAIISLAITGGAILVVSATSSALVYSLAVPAFIFLWFLAFPFVMGLLSSMDLSGRLAMSGIIIQTIGFTLGPALAGPLIERESYYEFAAACAIVFGAALACFMSIDHGNARQVHNV